MGKSRAEIQRAYRDRKKVKDGKNYLKKESERVKTYYKPTTVIEPSKLIIRRERIRKCMQRLRQRQNEAYDDHNSQTEEQTDNNSNQEVITHDQGPCDSTTAIAIPSTSHEDDNTKMIVDMKFPERRKRWKNKSLVKKSNMKIKKLEARLSVLKKRNNTLRKRLQRVNDKPGSQSPLSSNEQEINSPPLTATAGKKRKLPGNELSMTPKSKSIYLLRSEGLTPRKHPKLTKQLIFHNSMVEEVKENIVQSRGRATQRKALQIVCGKIIKRYRMKSNSSKVLGVNRGQISKAEARKLVHKSRKTVQRMQMTEAVKGFLARDDNSACLPGKRDKLKTKAGNIQARVLNDYMYNLHLKFKSENPHLNIGFTTFCSYRPKFIKLVQFSARRTCLCQKHQNMALKVKALKSISVSTTENPDTLIGNNTDQELLQKLSECPADTIKYAQWTRKEVEHKGTITKRMMIANLELPKTEFIDLFMNDISEFRKHTDRVKTQYVQIKALKETRNVFKKDKRRRFKNKRAQRALGAHLRKRSKVTEEPFTEDH